jgi:LSD1 subclass zinc finger protein
LIGFITVIMLIPTKKAIESGQAFRMSSPLVPSIIWSGISAAFIMFPLSLLAGSSAVRIAGIATSLILIAAYVAILFEHRAMKRHLATTMLPLEEMHRHNGHDLMTVECPRCRHHLSIPHGSVQITCPNCGLSGSL